MAKSRGVKSIYDLGVPVWSPRRLSYIAQCPRKFYFAYIAKASAALGPSQVMGVFLHQRARKFFKEDGTPKFKSPDSFANAAGAYWTHLIKEGAMSGQKIEWGEKNPWAMKARDVKPICKRMYETLAEEGPPIFAEYKFNFVFEGRAYTGVIDSVRRDSDGAIVIRDYKSGSYSRKKISMSRQFTVYAIAFSVLCNGSEEFRRAVGVSDEEAKRFAGNPVYIPEDLKFEIMRFHNEKPEGLTFWRLRSIEKRLRELGLEELADKEGEIRGELENSLCEVDAEEPVTFLPVEIKPHYYDDLCEQIDMWTMMEYLMKEKGLFAVEKSELCPSCDYAEPCEQYNEKYRGTYHPPDDQLRLFEGFKPVPRANERLLIFPSRKGKRKKDDNQMRLLPKRKRKKKEKKKKEKKPKKGKAKSKKKAD